MRNEYIRVAARCVYIVLCGGLHADARLHGGMCCRSFADHLETKCCRLRSMRCSVLSCATGRDAQRARLPLTRACGARGRVRSSGWPALSRVCAALALYVEWALCST
eukprot:5560380-Prymnesium_polylepis.2